MAVSRMAKSILIALYLSCLFSLTGCGRSINYESNYFLLGKSIVFNTPVVYTSNLTESAVDSESLKYNMYLLREKDLDNYYPSLYADGKKKVTKIRKGMKFLVIKSFLVQPWGLQKSFSNGYRMLVVRDEENVKSVTWDGYVNDAEIMGK